MLVVTAEAMSQFTDPNDFDTAIVFADAATATLVHGPESPFLGKSRAWLYRPVLSARGEDGTILHHGRPGEPNVNMDGLKVFPMAVRQLIALLRRYDPTFGEHHGTVGIGLVMERVAYRPIRGAPEVAMLLTSFAVGQILQNGTLLTIQGGQNASTVIDGFTFWYAQGGYAIYIQNASPTIRNCRLLFNQVADGAAFDRGRARGDADHDLGPAHETALPVDLLDEIFDHLLGDVDIGDDAVAEEAVGEVDHDAAGERGTGALRAGLLAAALLLSIEAVQLWMPARESTLTAPGLALLSAALVALLEPESGR